MEEVLTVGFSFFKMRAVRVAAKCAPLGATERGGVWCGPGVGADPGPQGAHTLPATKTTFRK